MKAGLKLFSTGSNDREIYVHGFERQRLVEIFVVPGVFFEELGLNIRSYRRT